VAEYGSLDFTGQIDFFRAKINLPTRAWTDLWEGMHARAFVVAGAMRDDLLADLRRAVDAAISEGETLEQFRKRFDGIVARYGWQYKGGRNWRTRVIYDTNLRTSYQAGRYRQMKQIASRRPYWRYRHNDNARHPRLQHKSWDGLILRHDDPWWRTHFPPNGWGCRCYVESLAERDLERLGKSGPDPAPPIQWETVTVGQRGTSPRTVRVPKGIDPGWGYDVGEAAWGRQPHLTRLQEAEAPWRELKGFGPDHFGRGEVPVDEARAALGPEAKSAADVYALLRAAIDGQERIFTDPAGGRVLVGEAIADHIVESAKRLDGRERFFPLIPEILEDPFEIWVTFAVNEQSGRYSLRRRYVKMIRIDKTRVLGLVADAWDGYWLGLTVFRGTKTALKRLRQGWLAWGR